MITNNVFGVIILPSDILKNNAPHLKLTIKLFLDHHITTFTVYTLVSN